MPTVKIENLDLKISEKKFRDFRGFWVFDLADIFSFLRQDLTARLFFSWNPDFLNEKKGKLNEDNKRT